MAAKRSERASAPAKSKRGGRRDVPRSSLARRPRASHLGRGRYAAEQPRPMRPVTAPAAKAPPRRAEETPDVRRRDEETDGPAPKPRKPTKAMRDFMRDWSAAERRAAQKIVDFIECECVHIEGELAGERFLLEQWQERILREAFGRLRPDGTRRYRTVYIEIGRKNGKSTLCAAIAIYLLSEDGEPGAQVVSAAIDKAQALIVFEAARTMVELSPRLSAKILPFRGKMETVPGEGRAKASTYRVLSADGQGKKTHGLNVSGAVIDEFHTQPKNSPVWKLIKTGTGSRRQPMIFVITTSGDDLDTPCGEMHAKARAILDGKLKDDTFLPVIFAIDAKKHEEDPHYWKTEEAWREANPNLGVSVSLDYLREQCEEAQRSPAYQNTFLQLHLGVWTNQEVRWMPMDKWDACGIEPVDAMALRGRRACSGFDAGICRDLSAHVMLFPSKVTVPATADEPERAEDVFDVVARFFMPREMLKENIKATGKPLDLWAKQGWLTLTSGNVISFSEIRQSIREEYEFYRLRNLAYDRYLVAPMIEELEESIGEKSGKPEDEQLHLWPFGQGFASMSDPTKMLLEFVRGKKIRHGGNPILRWMMDCVTIATDPSGNVKPVKPDALKRAKRIDGVVALIMALARVLILLGESDAEPPNPFATTRDDELPEAA